MMIVRYSQKDAPVPKGWRFQLLEKHYAPERGYGVLIKEEEGDQILVTVHPNQLLITINGEVYRKDMSPKQMIYLAQRLLGAANE